MIFFNGFCDFYKSITVRRTAQPKDQWTDIPSFRDAIAASKNAVAFEQEFDFHHKPTFFDWGEADPAKPWRQKPYELMSDRACPFRGNKQYPIVNGFRDR